MNSLYGQILERTNILFIENENELLYSQIGGLDNPMFYECNVNNDELKDLFIYDPSSKSSFILETYLIEGEYIRIINHSFSDNVPKLGEWAVIADYNNDDIPDILTNHHGYEGKVKVFKGKNESSVLSFEAYNLIDEVLFYTDIDGNIQEMFISQYELPAWVDIDNDGDLDIVSYGENIGEATLFKNHSIEFNGSPNEFNYIATEDCWGGFLEEGNDTLILADTYGDCATSGKKQKNGDKNKLNKTKLHGGASFLIFDADLDGDLDLLLGDRFRSTSLALLINQPVDDNAFFGSQMPFFPEYNQPIEIQYFPMAFSIDADFDGIKDIIAAPFAIQIGNMENRNMAHFYKGNENGTYEFVENNFLVKDILDVGSCSKPTFVDFDNDGLQDLVLGNYGYYTTEHPANNSLFLYKNIGTQNAPTFELINEDWLNFSQLSNSFNRIRPAFGDLDGDGDTDVLLGNNGGTLIYGENVADEGNEIQIEEWQTLFMYITEGSYSSPFIFDFNDDGMMDILIGNGKGTISYYENLSTEQELFFDYQAPVELIGNINVTEPGEYTGQSDFCLFEKEDTTYLLTGSTTGKLKLYNNIGLDKEANLVKSFDDLDFGTITSPTIAVFDSNYHLIVGNRRGGLQTFNLDFTNDSIITNYNNLVIESEISIFPNPTSDLVNISNNTKEDYKCVILNIEGKIIRELEIKNQRKEEINISSFNSGIYYIQLLDLKTKNKLIKKIIKL